MKIMRRVALIAATGMGAIACGGGGGDASDQGGASTQPETVEIVMQDNLQFTPGSVTVKSGETIRFVFTNTGKLVHDALIADAHVQGEHEAAGGQNHDDHHAGPPPPFVTVAPGATEEIVHRFTTPGAIEIGCHQTGHYNAGMRIPVTVT